MKITIVMLVLMSMPAMPKPASSQSTPVSNLQPVIRSYDDITTDMAWTAAARAIEELPTNLGEQYIMKRVFSKTKLEFAEFLHRGQVKFTVSVSQASDGKIQIVATPTGKGWGNPRNDAQIKLLSDEFGSQLDKQIGLYRGQANGVGTDAGPFSSFRKTLIGVNVVARVALPIWIEPDGALTFPLAHTGTKPGEMLTITNLLLCMRYPVGDVSSECGTHAAGNRRIVVVLFNGARPRFLPSAPPSQTEGTAGVAGDTLDSLVCVFGNAIQCLQANQSKNLRELQRIESSAQRSSAQATWASGELMKFEQTGPEIAFEQTNVGSASKDDFAANIRRQLARFVDLPLGQ